VRGVEVLFCCVLCCWLWMHNAIGKKKIVVRVVKIEKVLHADTVEGMLMFSYCCMLMWSHLPCAHSTSNVLLTCC
jgi:hypothetical protein